MTPKLKFLAQPCLSSRPTDTSLLDMTKWRYLRKPQLRDPFSCTQVCSSFCTSYNMSGTIIHPVTPARQVGVILDTSFPHPLITSSTFCPNYISNTSTLSFSEANCLVLLPSRVLDLLLLPRQQQSPFPAFQLVLMLQLK